MNSLWSSEAHSNIALIKYMGNWNGNIPCNVSLSYTLDKFTSRVMLKNCLKEDEFESNINFDKKSIDKFLNHLIRIKKIFNYDGFFHAESLNNFPHSAGIASSASSFAALTKCAIIAICEIKSVSIPSLEEMSEISRKGSGSSCRSFFSPWCVWDCKCAKKIYIKAEQLNHDLVLVNEKPKEISSSEAHKLVRSSLLFKHRSERAETRFKSLVHYLNCDMWSDAYQTCWEEFWDMHAMFETSCRSFGYIQPETIMVLNEIRSFWKDYSDGPIVTVDAGPNVHLLWRNDQDTLRCKLKGTITSKNNKIRLL